MKPSNESEMHIIKRSKEFSDKILDFTFEQLIEIATENRKKENQTLISDNIENIETGLSGFLFFLLEYYKYSEHNIYLKKAECLSESLITYCKDNPTGNYSLYTGRAGFVYFLTQLYLVNKDESLLHACELLILPAENEYLTSKYTSDYLYNGRAGTLLVLIGLFQITRSEKMFALIVKLSDRIIGNATLTKKGISWKAEEEVNLGNSVGFALGASGIQYVFKILDRCFPNQSLGSIVTDIAKYKLFCWDKNNKSWLNLEKDILNPSMLNEMTRQYKLSDRGLYNPTHTLNWSSGCAGVLLSEDNVTDFIFEFVQHDENISRNIFDGLAGIGLSLLENDQLINRDEQLYLIQEKLSDLSVPITLDGGLFFGELGVVYFLLKSLKNDDENPKTIIKPHLVTSQVISESVSGTGFPNVFKTLLSSVYGNTLQLIDKIYNPMLGDFLANIEDVSGKTTVEKFEKFIDDRINQVNTAVNNVIMDIFEFEQKKKRFAEREQRTNLEVYFDKLNHVERINRILNNSDEWILDQMLRISDKVEIVKTKWDWEPKDNFNFFQNFYNAPDTYLFLLHRGKDSVNEYPLRIDGLVLQRFEQKKKIKEALNEIQYFSQSLPEQTLNEFAKNSGSKDIKDFVNRLDFLVLYKIKQFLWEDILKLA